MLPFQSRQIKSRTAAGRLRALDNYLEKFERDLLTQNSDQVLIDLGFGEWPWTTTEMAERLWSVNPEIRIIGLETDSRRVDNASPFASPRLDFRLVQDSLQQTVPESIRLIRAMNVLRGYPKTEANTALLQWGAALADQGLLIEGTSDATGDILTAHIIRKVDSVLVQESLLFYTNFERGFAPWMFRDHLPVDLRRDVRPGTRIHALFTKWHEAWQAHRASSLSVSEVFSRSVQDVLPNQDPRLTQTGYAIWPYSRRDL